MNILLLKKGLAATMNDVEAINFMAEAQPGLVLVFGPPACGKTRFVEGCRRKDWVDGDVTARLSFAPRLFRDMVLPVRKWQRRGKCSPEGQASPTAEMRRINDLTEWAEKRMVVVETSCDALVEYLIQLFVNPLF